LCKDDTTLFTDTVTGGIWSGSGAFTTISAAGLVYARNPGKDTIFYTVSRLGCTSIATKIITVNPLPGAGTITGLDSICRGAVITLTDSTGHGFWTSSAPFIATADSTSGIVTGMNLGTAIITYTTSADTNGCSGKSTFSVTVINPDFSVSGIVVPDKCYASSDGSIAITITGGAPPFQYLWSTGGTSANITNLSQGTYSVKITESETQCIITDTFTVAATDSLTLTADVISDVCLTHNGSIAITASGGTPPYQYQWSTGSTGSQLGGLGVGIYTVTVTDNNGCTSLLPIPVVDSSCPSIIIHDAISPNGDGINDTWIIEGISHYPGNTVQVFDKWGDLVYEHDNYQNDWACTGKNGLVPDGTYYYLVKLNKYKTPDGRNSFTGSLLVKR
jgi:gliding motility-associated-like protein